MWGFLYCPNGHRWKPARSAARPAGQAPRCPVCGAAPAPVSLTAPGTWLLLAALEVAAVLAGIWCLAYQDWTWCLGPLGTAAFLPLVAIWVYCADSHTRAMLQANPPAARSGAVTALGIVHIILGALHLIGCPVVVAVLGFYIVLFGAFSRGWRPQGQPPPGERPFQQQVEAFFPLLAGLLLVGLVVSLLFLVTGLGLLFRRPWGRVLAFFLGGLAGTLAVAILVGGLVSLDLSGMNLGALLVYGCYSAAVFATLPRRKFAVEFSGRPRGRVGRSGH